MSELKIKMLEECIKAIERFSNFSKWWASINIITLSGFLVALSFLIKNINFWYIKLIIIFVYLLTIVLCNIMAINYLALEKSARTEYNKVNQGQKEINWSKVKVKPNFIKACKSWSIFIPIIIYFTYLAFLIILAFV